MEGYTEIVMLETKPGSPDGMNVNVYQRDKKYTIPNRLAQVFQDNGLCVLASEVPKLENKSETGAPENASIQTAPENASSEETKEEETKESVDVEESTLVHQLAKKLGVSSKEVTKFAKDNGMGKLKGSNKLSVEQVKTITEGLSK